MQAGVVLHAGRAGTHAGRGRPERGTPWYARGLRSSRTRDGPVRTQDGVVPHAGRADHAYGTRPARARDGSGLTAATACEPGEGTAAIAKRRRPGEADASSAYRRRERRSTTVKGKGQRADASTVMQSRGLASSGAWSGRKATLGQFQCLDGHAVPGTNRCLPRRSDRRRTGVSMP